MMGVRTAAFHLGKGVTPWPRPEAVNFIDEDLGKLTINILCIRSTRVAI